MIKKISQEEIKKALKLLEDASKQEDTEDKVKCIKALDKADQTSRELNNFINSMKFSPERSALLNLIGNVVARIDEAKMYLE